VRLRHRQPQIVRPVARKVVKTGLAAGQYLHELAEEAKEDIQDLTAEAQAELSEKKTRRKASASTATH
jgi:hypothetical protein